MHCDHCNTTIDPETDRHLEHTERLVLPEWGVDDTNGKILCEDCMDPELTKLTPG